MDFIGIGAQKAGTTWLYNRLVELDEFSLPVIKEMHYFDRNPKYLSRSYLSEKTLFNKIKEKAWRHEVFHQVKENLKYRDSDRIRQLRKYFFSRMSDEWYLSFFESSNKISGEITPAYAILDYEGVGEIYKLVPEVKLIFFIRNPIERAWSNYSFSQRHSDRIDLNEKEIIKFIDSPAQELRSDYLHTIETYSKFFDKKQILIGFYDAIKLQPEKLLTEVVSFLNGDISSVKKCNFHEKNNITRNKEEMPQPIRDYLMTKYETQISNLNNLLGSYCELWMSDTRLPEYSREFKPVAYL